jgi:beta-barrel assembly-enhancing protease
MAKVAAIRKRFYRVFLDVVPIFTTDRCKLVNFRFIFLMTVTVAIGGCSVNPVTGERQLSLISTGEQIAIGEAQYFPSRQMQGGDFVADPALGAYVTEVGERVAQYSDLALPYEFVVLNSSVPNAWALPGGKIAVNRGLLLELGSEAELAAVLGHEIVHAAAGHGAQAMQRGMLLQGVLAATTIAAQSSDYSNLAIGAAALGSQLLNQRYSRGAELESDYFGIGYLADAGYDPMAAVALQETFVRLSEGQASDDWVAGLFASHPPSQERVDRNRETAAALGSGGQLERERFQSATAALRRNQAAYETYDSARSALAEDRLLDATRLADQALQSVPGEANFHALQGDIDFREDRVDEAIDHYANAIELNNRFFYYHLQKGLAHVLQRASGSAQDHLEASIDLFPTADAHYGLGRLAEEAGDSAAAIEHYSVAAGAESPAGRAARDAMIRLDLPQNPGKYLQLASYTDAQGQLIIQVANPTNVTVANLNLEIRYVDGQAGIRQLNRTLNRSLAPGAGTQLATGLGPFNNAASYQVKIQAAQVVN